MAYFDSTKNRALWEIELQALRKEKAERAAGKVVAPVKHTEAKIGTERLPVRTNYKELLKEEAAASQKTPNKRRPAMEASKNEPQKKARTHEMA